jgi:hypothetical protein
MERREGMAVIMVEEGTVVVVGGEVELIVELPLKFFSSLDVIQDLARYHVRYLKALDCLAPGSLMDVHYICTTRCRVTTDYSTNSI